VYAENLDKAGLYYKYCRPFPLLTMPVKHSASVYHVTNLGGVLWIDWQDLPGKLLQIDQRSTFKGVNNCYW